MSDLYSLMGAIFITSVALIAVYLSRHLKDGDFEERVKGRTVLVLMVVIAIVVEASVGGMWLPEEKVELAGQDPVVAYVISSDDGWTTLLQSFAVVGECCGLCSPA